MLSRHLKWELKPPGGVRPGEHVLPGPQPYNEHSHLHQLLTGTYVPTSSS
jgi:hypothetical protein